MDVIKDNFNSDSSEFDFTSSSDDVYLEYENDTSSDEDVYLAYENNIEEKLNSLLIEFVKWFKKFKLPIIEEHIQECISTVDSSTLLKKYHDIFITLYKSGIFGEFHIYMSLNNAEIPLTLAIRINQRQFLKTAFLESNINIKIKIKNERMEDNLI